MNFVTGRVGSDDGKPSFVGTGLKVDFHENEAPALAEFPAEGKAVELGVRAEDIDVEKCEASHDVNLGCVALVEPLGDCKLLHVSVNSDASTSPGETAKLVCKVEPRVNIEKGDDVRLRFRAENVHLFDAADGHNLTLDRA